MQIAKSHAEPINGKWRYFLEFKEASTDRSTAYMATVQGDQVLLLRYENYDVIYNKAILPFVRFSIVSNFIKPQCNLTRLARRSAARLSFQFTSGGFYVVAPA